MKTGPSFPLLSAICALFFLASCEEPPSPGQDPPRAEDVREVFESTATRNQAARDQIHQEITDDPIPTSPKELPKEDSSSEHD